MIITDEQADAIIDDNRTELRQTLKDLFENTRAAAARFDDGVVLILCRGNTALILMGTLEGIGNAVAQSNQEKNGGPN